MFCCSSPRSLSYPDRFTASRIIISPLFYSHAFISDLFVFFARVKRAMYTLNIESTVKGAFKKVWIVFNLFQHVFTVLQFIPKYGSSLQCTRVLVFVLILYVPVNNFSVMSGWTFLGWTSNKQRMECIAQGHSAVVVWWAVISYSCPSWKDAACRWIKMRSY